VSARRSRLPRVSVCVLAGMCALPGRLSGEVCDCEVRAMIGRSASLTLYVILCAVCAVCAVLNW
jgi:hypothetical protein